MAIVPDINKDAIRKRMEDFLKTVEELQIEALLELGEMCVAHARSVPQAIGFGDVTGNLRSSIGYTLFVDGVAYNSLFESVKGGTEGVLAGQRLAAKVGEQSTGLCLVVVAGMHYAVAVESRGKDVITSAEQLAITKLPAMIATLTSDITSV